ncbi:NAD(+)/NADH kinase [Halomarina pelagica]|uniref:NAD(+)/NADH kinase n=1 Tax=Halomarina pelagica TaxID=2961599 RepID=UPI0020C3D84D|nr:NAD(+)/NADH kinase [Halomarina sp. BND7]
MRVGIVAQKDNARAAGLASDIHDAVPAEVVLDSATAAATGLDGIPVDEMDACDLVVSIGGDGTFLFAARGARDTPIMGVNLGEVGFLNATAPEESVETVAAVVDAYESGTMDVLTMPRVQATGEGWTLPPSLNEVVVMGRQRGHGNGIDVETRVDGARYADGRADGVLVATPTGSTAYNLSEGGPLVHSATDALVVTEMCARGGMPPLVVDAGRTVTLRIEGGNGAVVVGDGRLTREIEPPAEVTIRRAETPLRIAGPDLEFFAALGKLD